MNKRYLLIVIFSILFATSFSQTLPPGCSGALPFCAGSSSTGISFPNTTNSQLKVIDEMFKEIYAVNPLIISANKQYAGRSILPSVTLRGEEIPKVDLPGKGTALTPDVKKLLTQYADMMLKSVRIRDPQLQTQVTAYITNLWKTGVHSPTTFKKQLLTQFPQLRRRT